MKKKIFLSLLVFVGLFMITGCDENSNDTKSDKFTISDAVGNYENVGLLMNNNVTYVLNDDNTFDQTANISSLTFKGLFDVNEKGSIILNKNKSSTNEVYTKYGDYFYLSEGAIGYFDKDEEYGKNITLDENGKSSQTFSSFHHDINRDSTGSQLYYVFTLVFANDGTFKLYTYYRSLGTYSTNNNSFEGTYNVKDDIITLNYMEKEHTLLIVDNKIYFDVIKKID